MYFSVVRRHLVWGIVVLSASIAHASSVGFTLKFAGDTTKYSSDFGWFSAAEFKAYGYSAPSILAPQHGPVQLEAGTFQTMCAEYFEDMHLDTLYYGTVDDRVIFNGDAAHPEGIPLYDAAALLFSKFWHGTLDGYAGQRYYYGALDATATGREESAKSLEKVLWAIENQIPNFLAMPDDPRALAWYNQAILDVGGVTKTGHPGDVRVLNVWKDQASAYTWDGRLQSQLIAVVPLPASVYGGATLLGLVLAARGVSALRKRQSAAR